MNLLAISTGDGVHEANKDILCQLWIVVIDIMVPNRCIYVHGLFDLSKTATVKQILNKSEHYSQPTTDLMKIILKRFLTNY